MEKQKIKNQDNPTYFLNKVVMENLNKVFNEILNEKYPQTIPQFKNAFYYYSDDTTKNKYFYTTSKKLKNKDSKRKGYISGVYVYVKSKKHFKARNKKGHAKKKDAIARALKLSKELKR